MRKILFLLFGLGLACTSVSVKTPSSDSSSGQWSGKMHALSQVLTSLYPYIWSKEDFHNENNFATIEDKIKQLSNLAHKVSDKNNIESPDEDPAIKFLARNFDSDMSRAYDAFRGGSKEYARHSLALATNHCINCHSRSQVGPQFETLSLSFDFSKLNSFARGEAYIATRQFKKAVAEYESVTSRQDLIRNYPFEIEKVLKRSLSVYIRVFDDPDGALSTIQKFLKTPDMPLFLEKQAKAWEKDLLAWKKEGSRKVWRNSQYLKRMQELIADADHRDGFREFDDPLVSYLRATALGHIYLAKYKDDPNTPEVLFHMGVCYETMQDLGYESLSDDYYTQCIREKPHSPIAVKCLYRYEQNVYIGYTGSSGTRIPADVRAQLRELRELAL